VRILALDPGGTTGYAIAEIPLPGLVELAYSQRKMDESELWDFLDAVQPNHIVCEDFEYRNKPPTGLDLTPIKLIGVVNLFATNRNVRPELYMQKAAVGKGHFTDLRLKTLNVYQKGVPHGRDAARHLLHWFTFGPGFKLVKEPKLELVNEKDLLK
jgi:hypothetical protein